MYGIDLYDKGVWLVDGKIIKDEEKDASMSLPPVEE